MKFPEGGEFPREVCWLRNPAVRVNRKIPNRKSGLKQKSRASKKLFAQLQLFGDRLVTAHVGALEVIQQAAALADHHQQPATGAVILLVALQMPGQMVDALREQRNLHVGGTGVLRVQFE